MNALECGIPTAQRSGCVHLPALAVEPLLRVLSMVRVAVAVLNDSDAPKGGAKEEEKDERMDVLSFDGPVCARVTIRREGEEGTRHDLAKRKGEDGCSATSAAAMSLRGKRAGTAMGKRGLSAWGDRATVTSDQICGEVWGCGGVRKREVCKKKKK